MEEGASINDVRTQGGGGGEKCTTVLKSSVIIYVTKGTRHLLTKSRVRTGVAKGNQIHSSTLETLGIQKMYKGTICYKGKLSL